MDFTREPIIETIITPKDGCKLVVRSSKGAANQEEYFVDAVEVVAFGHAIFFRSLERPKPFLVPVADYEIMEVREARMVLKTVSSERSIKIGGGKEAGTRAHKEVEKPDITVPSIEEETTAGENEEATAEAGTDNKSDVRLDKKRDRRRHYRKRRNGKDETGDDKGSETTSDSVLDVNEKSAASIADEIALPTDLPTPLSPNVLSSLLQPPPTLISETINRYRENALFKNAFFMTEEEQYKPHDKVQDLLNEEDDFTTHLKEPTFDSEPTAEKTEEEITSITDHPSEIPAESEIKLPEVAEEPKKENGRASRKKVEQEPIPVEEPVQPNSLPLFSEDFNDLGEGEIPFQFEHPAENSKEENLPQQPTHPSLDQS